MPWSVHLTPPELIGPEDDRFRDAVAEVVDDGVVVGTMVVVVRDVMLWQGFHRWRPHWRPAEILVGWFTPSDGGRPDEEFLELDEVREARWGRLGLRWLEGPEREEAWTTYLAHWGPHEASTLAERERPGLL